MEERECRAMEPLKGKAARTPGLDPVCDAISVVTYAYDLERHWPDRRRAECEITRLGELFLPGDGGAGLRNGDGTRPA